MGEHELAGLALPPWFGGAAVGVDEFRMQNVQGNEMQVAANLRLAGEITQNVGDPVIGVAGGKAPGRLEAVAKRRIVEPGLAAKQPQPETEVARPEAGKAL